MIGRHPLLNRCQDSLRRKNVVPDIWLSSFFVYERMTEFILISIVSICQYFPVFTMGLVNSMHPWKKGLKIDPFSLTEEWWIFRTRDTRAMWQHVKNNMFEKEMDTFWGYERNQGYGGECRKVTRCERLAVILLHDGAGVEGINGFYYFYSQAAAVAGSICHTSLSEAHMEYNGRAPF